MWKFFAVDLFRCRGSDPVFGSDLLGPSGWLRHLDAGLDFGHAVPSSRLSRP